jgi:hypothetical protein
VDLIGDRYQANAGVTQFSDDLTTRIAATPGVVSVSASSMVPITGAMAQMTISSEGRPLENPAAAPSADTYAVRPDYFSTMGIPLITRLVMRQGMMPALVGLGAGLLGSVAIGRVIESLLFGVSSRDLVTYATVIALILAGAFAACLLPARRAASVDPAAALRAE